MKVLRVISKYNKVSEVLEDEVDISFIDINYLKVLFSPPKEDPKMYNSYEINKEKLLTLNSIVKLDMDFENFDYFLECYQTSKDD